MDIFQKNGSHWYNYKRSKRRLRGHQCALPTVHRRRTRRAGDDHRGLPFTPRFTERCCRPATSTRWIYPASGVPGSAAQPISRSISIRAAPCGPTGGAAYISPPGTATTYPSAIFNHVHYYDPASGFGDLTKLGFANRRAIDVGAVFPSASCVLPRRRCRNIYTSRDIVTRNSPIIEPCRRCRADRRRNSMATSGPSWSRPISGSPI